MRLAWFAALVALALHLPALGWGFSADDYTHQAVLDGRVEHPTLRKWSLYDFGTTPGTDEELSELLPAWWTSPDWKVRFFRPVSSLSLWLDHALFGSNAVGYHASSLAWYALLLGLVFAFYRAVGLAPRVAAGALFVFGAEGGSMVPVGWIANRNALVEAVFVVAAALAVARARQARPYAALALALLLALLAALAKESGIAAFLVVAVALLWRSTGSGPAIERSFALRGGLLSIVAAVGYLGFYVLRGFGAHTPFYPVPWREPGEFLAREAIALGAAAPVLTTPFASDLAFVLPWLAPWVALAGAALAVWIASAGRRALAGAPGNGMLLAFLLLTLIPQAGSPLGDRVYFVPAIGSAGLIASWISRAPRPTWAAVRRDAGARWSLFLILAAGVLSAGDLLLRQAIFGSVAAESRESVASAELEPATPAERFAVVLQAPNSLAALNPYGTWVGTGGDERVRFTSMQFGRRGLELTREDERTLRIESLGDPFLIHPFEPVLLSGTDPPEVGRVWHTREMDVEALAVEGVGVRTMRVTFRSGLEDARYRFLVWRNGRMRRLELPPIGESVSVEEAVPVHPLVP